MRAVVDPNRELCPRAMGHMSEIQSFFLPQKVPILPNATKMSAMVNPATKGRLQGNSSRDN